MGRSQAEQSAIDAVRAARPSNRLIAWKERICPECGDKFIVHDGQGRHQRFCKSDHRERFNSRCAARGKVIIPYLLVWRGSRGKKGSVGAEAHAEMIRIIDAFADEDRKAGRPKLDDYIASIIASGFTYADRRRS